MIVIQVLCIFIGAPYDRFVFYGCQIFISLILEVSPKQLFCFSLLNIMTWMTENFVIILQSFEHSK